MAVHNSTYYKTPTAAITAVFDKLNQAGGKDGSTLRLFYAKLTGGEQTLAQDDFVNLFDLPAGVKPLWQETKFGAFGASVTLDVGTIEKTAAATVDENRFESAVDVSAASAVALAAVDDTTVITVPTTVRAKFEAANPADDQDLEYWLVVADLN